MRAPSRCLGDRCLRQRTSPIRSHRLCCKRLFLKRFKVCARRNIWDDNERLDHLMCSLAAPVDQILWDFKSASILTWPDLVQKLRSRYGSKDQSALFQAHLAARRQTDGKGLATLIQDVRRLMTLAYPGCASEYGELLAVR